MMQFPQGAEEYGSAKSIRRRVAVKAFKTEIARGLFSRFGMVIRHGRQSQNKQGSAAPSSNG